MIRFGLQGSAQFPDGLPDVTYFRDVAHLVEESGFDSIWVGDHLSFGNPILDPFVALATFGAHTTTVTLGTGVVLMPLRHPTIVAKATASLDVLTGGRLVVGVGVGGEGEGDFSAVGLTPRDRGARTDEAITVLQRLWRETHVHHDGPRFPIADVTIDPRPVQPDGPPIWVGGRSEAALRRAARVGDGWLGGFYTPDGFAARRARIDELRGEAGRADRPFVQAHFVHVRLGHDTPAAEAAALDHLLTRYRMSADAARRYCIIGDPERVMRRIDQYVAAGVEHLVLVPIGGPTELLEQARWLAEQVVAPMRRDATGRTETPER